MFYLWKAEEEEQRLKYLEFVQLATIHALVCFSNLYGYAKDKSGPLKPGVETVEGTVKTVVGPVYDKLHDIPIELLKFVDRKVISASISCFSLPIMNAFISLCLFLSFIGIKSLQNMDFQLNMIFKIPSP